MMSLHDFGIEDPTPFLTYLSLLSRWNKTYNLTAIRDESEMWTYHILDSLAIAPYIRGEKILDVGSGAGLPGIPLALYFPEKHLTLVESQGKKCQFLEAAKRTLKLVNVTVIQARVEHFTPDEKFDTVLCRAVGKIKLLIALTRHLIQADGQWIFMKGQIPTDELQDLPDAYTVNAYQVQGLTGARCVVCVNNQQGEG